MALFRIMALMSGTALLEVYPGSFSFEEPWALPPSTHGTPLRRSTDGTAPRLATLVGLYYDPRSLFVVFVGEDDHVVASYREHDQPLYEEDVVEVFLAPSPPTEYFELEVNPIGTSFDARIVSPNGERATMRTDLGWDCRGCWNAVRREYFQGNQSRFDIVLAIPFESLGRRCPREGESWRANFYRIDRSPGGDEYTAWQPTFRNPADFHVPGAFGEIRFLR